MMISPRNDHAYDSNFEIAALGACRTGLYKNSNSLILLDLFTGGKIRNFKEINGLSLKSDRLLVQRFHEIDHIAPNIHFVIPGRRSEAQANPESSNRRQ